MLIILDTNVLVSGLLNPHGAPGRVLDLILAGEIRVTYDDRILSEYAEVLARPKLAIRPSRARAVLGFLQLAGIHISAVPLQITQVPDPDDLPFAEVAVTSHADALVTGNPKHFAFLNKHSVPVLSPSAFLDRWRETESPNG